MESEMQEASIQRTFSTYVDNYNELEKIRKDIQLYQKQFKGRMDQLKKENEEKERQRLREMEEEERQRLEAIEEPKRRLQREIEEKEKQRLHKIEVEHYEKILELNETIGAEMRKSIWDEHIKCSKCTYEICKKCVATLEKKYNIYQYHYHIFFLITLYSLKIIF